MTVINDWLRYFLSVAETLSFSTSADDLYVSQPTLSKGIRGLENELAVTLFERSTRKVTLTSEGKQLIPYAKKIVNSYAEMDLFLQRHIKFINNMLYIATLPVLHLYGLSKVITLYKHENQKINLRLTEADMLATIKTIQNEAIDVAIVRDCCVKKLKNFRIHHTFKDELAILCHKNHTLALEKEIPLTKLSEESFVLLNKGEDEYRESLLPYGYENLLRDNVVATVSSITALVQFIKLGFGIGLLSSNVCKNILLEDGLEEDIIVVPIQERPPFYLHIGTPNESPSIDTMKFINFIKENI